MTRSLCLSLLILAAGCQTDRFDPSLNRMRDQPRLESFEVGMRQPPDGAIPYGDGSAFERRISAERGRELFGIYCSPCHGKRGDGHGTVARYLVTQKPPALVDEHGARFTTDQMQRAIEVGYRIMPSYAAQLSPAERDAVIAYIQEDL